MIYTFPKYQFLSVIDHMTSLDINVVSISLSNDKYLMETVEDIPEEQLEHLEITEGT